MTRRKGTEHGVPVRLLAELRRHVDDSGRLGRPLPIETLAHKLNLSTRDVQLALLRLYPYPHGVHDVRLRPLDGGTAMELADVRIDLDHRHPTD